MATLRLFAGLRQLAGQSEVEIAGSSVGEVLADAVLEYGTEFEQGLATAKVWVNGEPASADTAVTASDEVAVIPPVSGGTDLEQQARDVTQTAVLPLLAWIVLLAANLGSEEWFAVILVGVGGAWAWDAFDEATGRANGMVRWPTLVSIVVGVGSAFTWGSEGLGVAVAIGVLLSLSWGVFDVSMRTVEGVGGTLLATVTTTVAAGSLVLIRVGTDGESRITALLIMLLVANVVLWVRLGSNDPGFLDPHTAAAIAVLIAGAVAGVVWDTDVVAMVIAAAAVAAAFLAGRAFGSAFRTGDLYLLQQPPGFFAPLDGAVLAAPLYWAVLALVA